MGFFGGVFQFGIIFHDSIKVVQVARWFSVSIRHGIPQTSRYLSHLGCQLLLRGGLLKHLLDLILYVCVYVYMYVYIHII